MQSDKLGVNSGCHEDVAIGSETLAKSFKVSK